MPPLTPIRPGYTTRLFPAALCLLLLTSFSSTAVAQSPDQGTWRIYYEPSRERVQLSFEHYENGARRHGSTSFGVRPSELRGLPLSQLSSYSGPARFQLVRDAGTFNFEGQLRDGHGTGFFTFSPDSRFPQQLASRGYERPTTEQQYWLAMHDVGYAMLDELQAQGYERTSVDQLVVMGMHGANLDYMKSLSAAGYRVGNTHWLVTLRDHGVSREFIGGLTDAGYKNLSLDDLQELRDHGVTPDFIASLRRFGFADLTTGQLLEARDQQKTRQHKYRVRCPDRRLDWNHMLLCQSDQCDERKVITEERQKQPGHVTSRFAALARGRKQPVPWTWLWTARGAAARPGPSS